MATTTPQNAGKEIGQSGTLIYNGIIVREEYNANLVGRRGNQIYDTMRRSDSVIRGALQVCKLPVQATTWNIDAAKNEDGVSEDKDKEIAAFIKRELMARNIDFDALKRDTLTMLDFGFYVGEIVLEPTEYNGNAYIGLAKISSRKQVSVEYWETEDGKPGIRQRTKDGVVSIPMDKLLVVTHDKEGDNYEGISLLRYAYKDWKIRDDVTLVNAISIEKSSVGVPVIQEKEGQTATPADRDSAEEILSEFRANERSYLMMPSTLTLEMLDMKAGNQRDPIPTLNYHDARIMKSILAGFMEIGGQSGSGSQSLSKDLIALFMKSEEALAKTIASAINEQVIKRLCDINFSDLPNGYPKLTFGKIADDDTTALATALQALQAAGLLTPDADVEEYLRTQYHLPAMSKEMKDKYDELHTPVSQPTQDIGTPDKKVVKDVTKDNPKPKDVNAAIAAAAKHRNVLLGMVAEG